MEPHTALIYVQMGQIPSKSISPTVTINVCQRSHSVNAAGVLHSVPALRVTAAVSAGRHRGIGTGNIKIPPVGRVRSLRRIEQGTGLSFKNP